MLALIEIRRRKLQFGFVTGVVALIAYRKWVASMLRAGAQPNINAAEYSALPLALPPLTEQRAIAATLDSVDATIERAGEEGLVLGLMKTATADVLLTGRVRLSGVG